MKHIYSKRTKAHIHSISNPVFGYFKVSAAPVPRQNLRPPTELLKDASSQKLLTAASDIEHTLVPLSSVGSPLWTQVCTSLHPSHDLFSRLMKILVISHENVYRIEAKDKGLQNRGGKSVRPLCKSDRVVKG